MSFEKINIFSVHIYIITYNLNDNLIKMVGLFKSSKSDPSPFKDETRITYISKNFLLKENDSFKKFQKIKRNA